MEGARTRARGRIAARRRRLAIGVVAALAAAAFAAGCDLANRVGGGGAAMPTVAETLPLGQLAGERVVVGLDGSGVSPKLERAIRRGDIAGVVLFASNFPSRAAGRRLIARLQAIPRPPKLRAPLLVMTDQEGGEVVRVEGPPDASAREMGERGAGFSRAQGRATAASLRELGVNVDLAPVLDVARSGGVIADTDRGFGETAARVTRTAVPFAEGLQAGGVAATAKHFPGLGAAAENTDFEPQRIDLDKEELRGIDEFPYRAYVRSGGKLVMLSTATYRGLSIAPAAFSRAIATDELRHKLGFRGVSITDSLGGAAVAAFGGQREAAVAGAAAGVDLMLFDDLPSALAGHAALVAQLRRGKLGRGRFETSAQRVLRLRAGLPGIRRGEPGRDGSAAP
jgi:beta-N-acetylhexosaminidase